MYGEKADMTFCGDATSGLSNAIVDKAAMRDSALGREWQEGCYLRGHNHKEFPGSLAGLGYGVRRRHWTGLWLEVLEIGLLAWVGLVGL